MRAFLLPRDYGRQIYATNRSMRRHRGPITQWLRHMAILLGFL